MCIRDSFKQAIREGISKVNIFTDINVAAVKAELEKFTDMNKGIIDLIPAAVEAVKQESIKKIQLFGSDGRAGREPAFGSLSASDLEKLTPVSYTHLSLPLNRRGTDRYRCHAFWRRSGRRTRHI